jgi:TonB family protein
MVEGFYHQNLKDGAWSFYSGGALVAGGNYKEGKKVGVWTGYTRGFERLKYDFTENRLLAYIPAGTDTVFAVKSANTTALVERRPIYINGTPTMAGFLSRNIRYPAVARENRRQGEVIISVLIDEDGCATDYIVTNSFDKQIEEEVLRAFKLLDGEWTPGFVNGKPVATVIEIPVLFEINKPDDTPHKPNQIIIVRGA